MLLIHCALYVEAAPLIKYFKLKKDLNYTSFDCFRSPAVDLIVSGIGIVRTASCLAHYFAINKTQNLLAINFGSCAASKNYQIGDLLIMNKIVSPNNRTCFYPDFFPKTNLLESTIHTILQPSYNTHLEQVVDMEAAAFAEVAQSYLDTSSYAVCKFVSDFHAPNSLREIEKLAENTLADFVKFLPFFHYQLYLKNPELDRIYLKYLQKLDLPPNKCLLLQEEILKTNINYVDLECYISNFSSTLDQEAGLHILINKIHES